MWTVLFDRAKCGIYQLGPHGGPVLTPPVGPGISGQLREAPTTSGNARRHGGNRNRQAYAARIA
ncbi:hypothetical protein MBRA_08840 [Mycobacterium branderi]|uniref:Uncharacterized protein n=1 Tax=Mycobacterium branderi TaxID=43348 RepID=A0ABM7KHQ1_9MYCO|nr:hypothetical protein MBRA_08840 [Mycobacterium branderi]